MRKIVNILMVLSIITFLAVSCENKEDFLDKKPLGEYSELDVWKDTSLIETFVNSMYRNALGFPFSIVRLSDLSDESQFTPDWGALDFNKSLLSPDGTKIWGTEWASPHTYHYQWAPLYKNVRRSNVFFNKIGEAKTADERSINRLKGEAYFLRAYTYHYLVAVYGGVPIITTAYGLNDDFSVARSSYDECVKFIVGQLDSAAMYLPISYKDAKNSGRATKGAALALKARVLLYAASDLHNPQKNSFLASGFSNPELLGYTTGDAASRWQAAKVAAKAVIDLNNYDLYKKNPGPTDSVAQNIAEYFISSGTSEDILLQFFSTKTDEDWQGYNPALYCGPNGYHNWGNNCPIGELVDDYEMKDGSKFNWNNASHKASPYQNREARFYATVLYEGAPWRTRPSDALAIDPFSKIQIGFVTKADGTVLKAGLDTRKGPIEDWNGTYTGYYVRKFVNPAVDPQYVKQEVPFRHIRYAEVLMNYAEACIELGQDGEALTYINMIRRRAGQPEFSGLTGDALRQAYRHERRIEFAYEDQRFWDIRRWLIAAASYKPTHAIDVKYVTSESSIQAYRKADGSTHGAATYNSILTPGDARAWDNKAYFFPIERDEMNKNTKLIQNPGY